MIEEEIYREIQEDKSDAEGLIFPREEWDSLIHWSPVSNIPVEEIYKDLPEVKRHHDDYVKLWNLRTTKKER